MPHAAIPSLPGPLGMWLFDADDAEKVTCVRNHLSANAHDDNLLPAPEQFFNPTYATGAPAFYSALAMTITDGGFTDPFGGTKASRIVCTSSTKLLQSTPTASALLPAGTYTLSVYLKSNDGNASSGWQFSFGTVNGDPGMTINVPNTGVWQRYSYTFTVNGTQTNNRVVLYKPDATTPNVLIYGLKLNAGSTATDYVPADFEMRLGLGTTRPTWTSEGITTDSGDIGIAMGQSYPTFAAMSGYMTLRVDDASASRVSIRDINSYPSPSPGFTAGTINSQGTNRQGMTAASPADPLRVISPVVDGKYHVIAWTWDGSTVRYYLDGTFVKSVAASTGWTSKGFLLGDASVPFVGKRGPHAIYTSAHTADQVRQMTKWMAAEMKSRSVTVNNLRTLIGFEGDSITEIFGTWGGYSYTFRTLQGLSPVQHGTTNALSGSTLYTAPDINSRTAAFDAMLAPAKDYPICSVWIGTNDINASQTAQDTFDRLKAYCLARKAAGWHRVIVWTCLPRNVGGTFETRRLAYNTLIRNASAEGWYDHLADIGADALMGDPTTYFSTYTSDDVHPNQAGHDRILTEYAIPAFNAMLALPPKKGPSTRWVGGWPGAMSANSPFNLGPFIL